MSDQRKESLRNVAMISSAGAGKTSLAEAMLFATGAVSHLGSIAQGTTVCTVAVPSVPASSVAPGMAPPLISLTPPVR